MQDIVIGQYGHTSGGKIHALWRKYPVRDCEYYCCKIDNEIDSNELVNIMAIHSIFQTISVKFSKFLEFTLTSPSINYIVSIIRWC